MPLLPLGVFAKISDTKAERRIRATAIRCVCVFYSLDQKEMGVGAPTLARYLSACLRSAGRLWPIVSIVTVMGQQFGAEVATYITAHTHTDTQTQGAG